MGKIKLESNDSKISAIKNKIIDKFDPHNPEHYYIFFSESCANESLGEIRLLRSLYLSNTCKMNFPPEQISEMDVKQNCLSAIDRVISELTESKKDTFEPKPQILESNEELHLISRLIAETSQGIVSADRAYYFLKFCGENGINCMEEYIKDYFTKQNQDLPKRFQYSECTLKQLVYNTISPIVIEFGKHFHGCDASRWVS